MKEYKINGKQYFLISDYKNDNMMRNSFNMLTKKIYEFDFEKWYKNDYWKEQYIPYSLVYENTVVANVSVNIMDFIIDGKKKRYIQLGTVMTDENHRRQGLSRILIEEILKEWEKKCNMIYLFANDSVLDFYPKFGFEPRNEYQYSKSVIKIDRVANVKKLNMNNISERNLLFNKASNNNSYSRFKMLNNPSLIMFYCISFLKDNIYYIKEYDAIVIANIDKETIYIYDVFADKNIEFDAIINSILTKESHKVILGFVPVEKSNYEINLLNEEDNTLFIKVITDDLPKNIIFPALSHA